MVLKCGQLLAIIFAAGVLGAVVLSFSFAKFPKLEPVPDRLTGYPTWHGAYEGYNGNKNDSMLVLSIAILFVSSILGLKLVTNPPRKPNVAAHFVTVPDNGDQEIVVTGVPTIGFDRLLVLYTWATFVTAVVNILIDLGKMWGVFGLFHTTLELTTLILLGNGGKIRSATSWAWILFYLLLSGGIVVLTDFPIDVSYFKFQGLCMDFALLIEYVRIYIATKKHLHDAGNETQETLPLNSDEIDDDDNDAQSLWTTSVDHPKQILLLIIASGVHAFGNSWGTVYYTAATSALIFEFGYPIAFSIYIYFVYLDTQATSTLPRKNIYIPYTPKWKVVLITIIVILLSSSTIRLSLT